MTLQQNTDRIQTTHIGSLPRPHALLDVMKAKYAGQPYDQTAYASMLTRAASMCWSMRTSFPAAARHGPRRPRATARGY